MRITFEEHTRSVDRTTNEYGRNRTKETKRTDCFALDISGMVMDNTAYGVQGRTAEDVMRDASVVDTEVLRDYMTVMSNSMSEEDFARLQKEGRSPMSTEIEEVVTIVDKIKAELAKAGVEVVGYTDTLDTETLTRIAGSETYALAIENAFKQADVPLTKQNVTEAVNAMDKAKELSALTEGAEKYMLDNRLEPTIDNLYLAEFSGADRNHRQAMGYYREESSGYYTKRAGVADMESLKDQVEQILVREGLEINAENLTRAEFLIQKGIPLTGENLGLLERVENTQLPVLEKDVWKAIATALSEGKDAGKANIYDVSSIYEKAAAADRSVDELLLEAEKSGNITRYRQLQEVRLMMTVEANVKLLKSGFSIDTGNLEELVDALKALEQKQAEKMFSASANPVSDYGLYKETIIKTSALPGMPIDIIGKIAGRVLETSIDDLYEEGAALRKSYEDARHNYETLMTTPRKDLGDRIQTAFRNIDDILTSMGLNLTEENRRAVRILGYNSTEITDENLSKVKDADRTVQRVISKLTPAKVLQMIRDGVNPLEQGLGEIETYLDGQQAYEEEAEKYSAYLYGLEKSGEITEDEKESYIGIYRLLRQIEKSDGAAIGQLLESGAQITFTNLLSAVRSSKAKGIDVSVDDNFGGLEELNARGISISDQINAGYTTGLIDSLIKEREVLDYNRELLEELRKLNEVNDGDINLLRKLEMPLTADYLFAASMLRKDRGGMIRKLWEKQGNTEDVPEAMKHIQEWEEGLTDFVSAKETYQTYIEQLKSMAENLTFTSADTTIDVREMQLIHKQLHVAGVAASNEEYNIPILLKDEMTAIHLTLRHDDNISGRVSVNMETSEYGKISARLTLQEGKISGYLIAETAKVQEVLQGTEEKFVLSMEELGMEVGEIPVVLGMVPEEESQALANTQKESTQELYQLARIFIQSLKTTLV